MVQHWSPMSQLQRAIDPAEWLMFDGSRKIAVLRVVELGRKHERMIRSVTWAPTSADRDLIGYFPHLEMAAWVTYRYYLTAVGRLPSVEQ